MAYIGKEPTTGNFIYADDITTSATNTYNILVGGVAFSPESANHLIVSLNGVIQKANTSFSVSGSQITFLPSSGTLSSSDSIDFILILGSVNDVGVATTVSDSAITKNKLNLISTSGSPGLEVKGDGSSENGTIQLNCSQNSHGVKISSPAHSAGQSYELILPTGNVTADKFLKVASVSGSGATGIGQLSFADAGGNTPAWKMGMSGSQSLSYDTVTKINFDTSIIDTDSGVDTTNKRYTIPSGKGGKYIVYCFYRTGTGTDTASHDILVRKNGSAINNEEDIAAYTVNQSYNTVQCMGMLELSAGDYIEMYARQADQNFTSTIGYSSEARFWGYRLIGV